ncbi:OmpA/MotB domain protein [Thioalkalivibrio sulfidiphilus HL-EbGr7]|uniref:OmpA/MotB domain protein n=1 Tax=Thioalkalivibrio sulfidiphilus (strain HL-EbGR7) TaxID=396588 RepID=B8GR09_THISH|nr:flagellar motor protein MotD [Thioalkalivibrio sulfidiphilus]ACL72429.1 OmpA/MotB domain protein [Thioalkalivibrio sulfidiphilus HL-EbGr7]
MSRRSRKHHEEHVNHEAWAIPYGDLITLLLAFFVVMYAISSVNEGKYRVLSDSLVAAFRAPPKSTEPIQIGEVGRPAPEMEQQQTRSLAPLDLGAAPAQPGVIDRGMDDLLRDAELDADELQAAAEGMSRLADEIERAMLPLMDADLIRMRRDRFWIEVEINTSLLFASGSAQLSSEAVPVLQRLATILRDFPARIQVEGFTDTVPINTPIFPSNWELSAARAASVVNLFSRNQLDPTRMAAIGYGEYRPIADNDTAEGRRQNRRVSIVVLAERRPRSERAVEADDLRDDLNEMVDPQDRNGGTR